MNRLFLSLLICYSIAAMQKQSTVLSKEESDCFQWYDQYKDIAGAALKNLSDEDSDVLVKHLLYSEHPQELTRTIANLAKQFCKHATAANIELKYNEKTLAATLLKMKIAMQNKSIEKPTDIVSARMYVFSQLLTPEEQATVRRDNYLQNPEAAYATMEKSGYLLADELVKLKLIENTKEAKEKTAKEFKAKKIADLKKTYGQ